MNTITKLRGLAISTLAALALAACGGTTTTTTTSSSATTVVATSAPAAAITAEAVTTAAAPATTAAATTAAATATTAAATTAKLNLNTVTEEQLLNTIPGFGSRMVREFQEYRPYTSIVQFRKEIGKYVDEAQVSTYEQYVYVPISVDSADAATLQQIPGLDAATAEALIAARPYNTNQAFLAKLAELAPGVDQNVASSFLAQ